jgi:hypothetical protein
MINHSCQSVVMDVVQAKVQLCEVVSAQIRLLRSLGVSLFGTGAEDASFGCDVNRWTVIGASPTSRQVWLQLFGGTTAIANNGVKPRLLVEIEFVLEQTKGIIGPLGYRLIHR